MKVAGVAWAHRVPVFSRRSGSENCCLEKAKKKKKKRNEGLLKQSHVFDCHFPDFFFINHRYFLGTFDEQRTLRFTEMNSSASSPHEFLFVHVYLLFS